MKEINSLGVTTFCTQEDVSLNNNIAQYWREQGIVAFNVRSVLYFNGPPEIMDKLHDRLVNDSFAVFICNTQRTDEEILNFTDQIDIYSNLREDVIPEEFFKGKDNKNYIEDLPFIPEVFKKFLDDKFYSTLIEMPYFTVYDTVFNRPPDHEKGIFTRIAHHLRDIKREN